MYLLVYLERRKVTRRAEVWREQWEKAVCDAASRAKAHRKAKRCPLEVALSIFFKSLKDTVDSSEISHPAPPDSLLPAGAFPTPQQKSAALTGFVSPFHSG